MEGTKRFTKADLLQGRSKVHYEFFPEVQAEIPLRPLTDGQWAEISAIKQSGIAFTGSPVVEKDGNLVPDPTSLKMTIEPSKVEAADYAGDVLAVLYGLADGETWSKDEVKAIQPPGLVRRIAKKVYEISGVNSKVAEELIKSFRGERRGDDDSSETLLEHATGE